jgi:hypothetical protein
LPARLRLPAEVFSTRPRESRIGNDR